MRSRLAVPGRTELAGNHTDHQGGRVLAAAVELYLRAEAESLPGREALIQSEGFGDLRIRLEDLSPAPEKTFWDVMDIAERPVICSHSAARALCDHPRNLTDAQIAAVVRNNGCIGVNLYAEFLGLGADLDAVLAHIDRFLSLGAAKNLCLGTDFDGIDAMPAGFTGVESMAGLYDAMLRRGCAESLVRDVFFNNLRAFFTRAL